MLSLLAIRKNLYRHLHCSHTGPVTADRFVAIHGHFYQPPRENPWLETVEVQDSAAPYHDWNERVAAECYAPNTAARRVAQDNRILDIVNTFEKISFNVGPTLLAWLERHTPDAYHKILEADGAERRTVATATRSPK